MNWKRAFLMTKSTERSIQVIQTECRDAEQLGELYDGPELRYLRYAPGPFRSQMRKAIFGDLMVHCNQHSNSMLVEGANRTGHVAIGFIGPNSTARRVLGESFTNSDAFLLGPRVEHLATVMPGQQAFQIFIPAEMLAREIAARLNRDPLEFADRRLILRIGRQGVGKLIGIVAECFRASETSQDSSFNLQVLQASVVERVVTVLTATENDLIRESRSARSIGQILLRTRAYCDATAGTPTSLGDLCRAVGVGQRRLQLAFAEGLGISPMRYMKLRRLNSVHEQLLKTTSDPPLIKQVARRVGFTHMGKFARDYKKVFGECPSETR